MVIYEVNLSIDKAIVDDFGKWLSGHIVEMLEFDGFVSADLLYVQQDDNLERANWCVQYHVRSEADLTDYFENHAKKMRNDGVARFNSHFSASRRILTKVATYKDMKYDG